VFKRGKKQLRTAPLFVKTQSSIMTDYNEEQQMEMEALQSIYPDELEIIEEEPQWSFKINIESQDPERFPDFAMSSELQFTYTPEYPDSAPLMEVSDYENMDDMELQQLIDLMAATAEENLGMAMVFTIITSVQEHLTESMERGAREKEEAEERKKQEYEERERKRFEGTRVTVETFLAWKAKFDAERAEDRRMKGFDDTIKLKPSGRELFFNDTTMNDSDVKFLIDGDEDESLDVDESLFDDMGDLDLDDDNDDPDYEP